MKPEQPETETWWVATTWDLKPVEVVRTTNKKVFFKNGRIANMDSSGNYYRKTKEEANAALLLEIELDIKRAEADVTYFKSQYEKLKERIA